MPYAKKLQGNTEERTAWKLRKTKKETEGKEGEDTGKCKGGKMVDRGEGIRKGMTGKRKKKM